MVISITCCFIEKDFTTAVKGNLMIKGRLFWGQRHLLVHPAFVSFVHLNWGQMRVTVMRMGFSCMVKSIWKLLTDLGIYIWQIQVTLKSICAVPCIVLCWFILFIFFIQVVTFFFTSWKSLNVGDALYCWQLIPDLRHAVSIMGLQHVGSTHTWESERVWDFPSVEMWSVTLVILEVSSHW